MSRVFPIELGVYSRILSILRYNIDTTVKITEPIPLKHLYIHHTTFHRLSLPDSGGSRGHPTEGADGPHDAQMNVTELPYKPLPKVLMCSAMRPRL
jgi:hypothetical protein